MIKDNYDRIHNYLRISLTDKCNLRCFYCMPEEDYTFAQTEKLMTAEEIISLSKIFVSEGVTKIRLTGGEPLIRKDSAKIISALANLPVELTMTTNGIRIHHFIEVLKKSGIRSVNISLDTLQSDKFTLITRKAQFDQVWNNIQLLLKNSFHVKVNVVVMKGLNDNEINDFISWTKNVPIDVRFIEFMPFSGNRWSSNKVVTLEQILHTISVQYDFLPMQGTPHDTAKKFIIPGHAGTFAVISTMSSHFCGDCNRMRLTADGKLKNCLFSKGETDLLSPLRRGENITELIHQNIQSKARQLGGQFIQDFEHLHPEDVLNRSMIAIGG